MGRSIWTGDAPRTVMRWGSHPSLDDRDVGRGTSCAGSDVLQFLRLWEGLRLLWALSGMLDERSILKRCVLTIMISKSVRTPFETP